MLRTLWLTCVLLVASATAWAQSAPQPVVVDKAQTAARGAEQRLIQLTTQRAQMTRRYQDQLTTIDRLKKQKASWRRDRELNAAQADANDTAARLTGIDRQLKTAQQDLANRRRAVVVAIDAELAAGATGTRAEQLRRIRAQLVPAVPAPKKIVIPDAEIDPLADPEELERQAAAILVAEKQLDAQRKGLDQQAKDLRLAYELRQAHDRAGELSTRDDDQPHRGAARGASRGGDEVTAGAPGEGAGQTSGGGGTDTAGNFSGDKSTASFESTAVALGEVIDRSTVDGLLRASRSGDPKQRAEAAQAARDAVAKRLDLLKKKRAMIEQRAKQLRKK